MLERKAATKKTLRWVSVILSIALSAAVADVSVHAATKKKKTATKAAPANEKSKTVGDILKKIEKKSETVKFTKGGTALPKVQQQQQAPAKQVNLRAVTPPKSSQLYYEEGTDEAELEKILDEGISQLYTLARRSSKSSKRGELWLRLAELYVEKARLIEFRLMNEHDKKMQAFLAGKTKVRPKLSLTASTDYNRKAIQLYEWFLRDFPKDPKVDQALFFLGFNYFELGEYKKGEEYYAKLTKEFPNSLYVSESNFALGEFHFENERWKQARVFYDKVAAQKNSRLYSFAVYKIAWCLYKLNQSKEGMRFLETVILEGRRQKSVEQEKGSAGVSRIRLATEAIKDLIVFFAEAGDPNTARPYFEEIVGPKSANANLAKLAYFYMDTGNRSASRLIFRDLIDQDPNSVKAFDYQYAIVKMYGASGDPGVFKKELYYWIQLYGPGSSWQKVNAKDREAVSKGNELMEGLLRNHVLQQHQTAQNAKTKTSQANAKSGYALYFETFSDTAKADEMRFFYAELLFDMGEYEKAAANYGWITENKPDSPYFNKALINTLLALEKRLPTDQKVRSLVGDSSEPMEFTPEIKAFERAAKNYFAKDPAGKDNVAVRYRLGALYYLFNQFDPAIDIFVDVIKRFPNTPFAKFSSNHLLDIYNLKKDYVGLQNAADMILAVPALAKSDVGNQIKDIKLRTDFKLAKDLEDKKNYMEAAKAYEGFAKKNAGSELARGARFNAAVNFERAGAVLSAITMYSGFLTPVKGAKDDFGDKARKFLPVLYEKTGQYEKAAGLFESYALANPKDAISTEYLFNAAVIYDGLNYYTAAVRNYEKYMQVNKKRDKVEALFLLAKISERRGQLDKAISYYNQYLNSGSPNSLAVVESAYSIAKLHERLNRKSVTEEWLNKTIAIQKRVAANAGKPVGASYAAEAKFKLVRKVFDELVSIKIPQSPKAQQAAIQNKLALLNKLKEQLKAVIIYDDGFQIVSALTLQGRSLEHMYVAILTAPLPKGLNAQETAEYKAGIQKYADPYKEQAIDAYKTAIEKGVSLQAYNNDLSVAIRNKSKLEGAATTDVNYEVILTKLPDWRKM